VLPDRQIGAFMKVKYLFMILLTLFCAALLTGCGEEKAEPANVYEVYYLNAAETKVEIHEKEIQTKVQAEILDRLLSYLAEEPTDPGYKSPLHMGFSINSFTLENGKILLDFSEGYNQLAPTTEVLVRAAIVMTLTQVSGINFVGFTVEGSPVYDNLSNVIGWMYADQFVNNAGSEINTYEEVRLKLYFANEAGDGLVAVNRTKLYNSNISLEKIVAEEVIKGPNGVDVYPTVNPATKIISVMVKDGTCYVNLDDSFLTTINNVTADVTIYSMVNSLAEINGINKVQFSVNGDSTGVFRERYNLSTIFERNLDIVTNLS
jgi:germination protein M